MTNTIIVTRRSGTKPLLEVKVATRQRAPKYRTAQAGIRRIMRAVRASFPAARFKVAVR